MGYVRNDTILVEVAWDQDRVAQILAGFRSQLPEQWRPLLVGPVVALANGSHYWTFHPDGSKEWWDTSDEGDVHRAALIALLEQIGCYYACVRWGGDYQKEHGVAGWGNP
jgi:hypothetical protein